MTDLTDLLATCNALDIRLVPVGKDGLTIDLIQRLKANKGELLMMSRAKRDTSAIDVTDATAVWHAVLDQVEGNPLFPPEAMAALRSAEMRWESDAGDAPASRRASGQGT